MFNQALLGTGGGGSDLDLTEGLISQYLLNNNGDDSHGTYDGTIVGTVDFQGDQLDPLAGSVTIPATGGSWCSYWKDTGTGMTLVTSATIPTSLATDNYSNLRVYDSVKSAAFISLLEAEGYYPKPLPLPTTVGRVAHYPLTGTAEDTTGNYDGTENGLVYSHDAERGATTDQDGVVNSYVTAPLIANAPITVSVMSYISSLSSNCYMFDSQGVRSIIGYRNNSINVYSVYTDGTWQNFTVSTIFDRWVNVTVTIVGNTASLYIDGVFMNSITIGTFTVSGTSQLAHSGTGNVIKSSSFRLYNRELTATEITDIYNYEKNFRPIDIDDGLVVYCPLAKNSLDNYYNEFDGVDTDMAYNGSSGVFNGSTSNITLGGTVDTYKLLKQSFSCWVNIADDSGIAYIFDNNSNPQSAGNTANSGVGIFAYNGNIYGNFVMLNSETYTDELLNTTTNYIVDIPFPYTLNTWVHVAYTLEDNTLILYMNGVRVNSVTVTQNARFSTTNNWVGLGSRYQVTHAYPMNGQIAIGRFFNKTIKAEQVEVIYNSEKGDFI